MKRHRIIPRDTKRPNSTCIGISRDNMREMTQLDTVWRYVASYLIMPTRGLDGAATRPYDIFLASMNNIKLVNKD